jgi:hypothetical protein
MDQRKTSNSGFAKSILAVMLATASAVGWGQVANTATGPNKVYIEQVGNTNTITLEQVGGTNGIGGTVSTNGAWDAPSSSNYATVTGSSNIVAVTQHGDNNLGQYNIRGNNNTYTSTVTGSNNKIKLDVGDVNNASNLRNSITETITGDSNTIKQIVIGNDITSVLAIVGNTNEVTKELKSTNGISDISITGNSNKLDAQQIDSSGAVGHYLKQVIAGDFNSIVTQQQGSNDTTIDIKATGSHNNITVRTSSSAIVSPVTAIAR